MTCDDIRRLLSDEQKGQICGTLSVGCDRETAADFVGCSTADIGRAMQRDAAFAANIRRTEASCELSHMRNVQQAAKDAKNWRASVWWLERHSPERFGPRRAGSVTARQLKEFVDTLTAILNEEISNEADHHRVVARLDQAIASMDKMVLPEVPDSTASNGEQVPDISAAGFDQDSTRFT